LKAKWRRNFRYNTAKKYILKVVWCMAEILFSYHHGF